MGSVRKQQLRINKKRRHLVYLTISFLLFIYLTFSLIVGENGLMRYIKLKSMRDRFHAENFVIKVQNEDMKARIDSYDSEPSLYEGLAREYGLTKEGELIFKFEDKE